MWIKKFSNWLTEIQLKLIDKKGKRSFLEKVKRRNFLNHLPPYMEATLIPQFQEDWTNEYLVPQAESYEASKPHNADRNRLMNRQQQQKTGFNPSNNNSSNRPGKGHPTNNPDLDTMKRNLDQKTKMELIRPKKCLWCRNTGHNYKDCRKWQAKQPMVTAAQALSIRREWRQKGFNEDKTKEQPQFKATKPKPTNFSKVLVKADMYPSLAPVDLQIEVEDRIDSKFVHLYSIPTRLSEKKTLTTAIKGS